MRNTALSRRDFLSAELEIVPAFRARDLGFDRSMIGGLWPRRPGLRVSCADRPARRWSVPAYTAVTILADKEETGSEGNTGMQSAFLRLFHRGHCRRALGRRPAMC